MKKVLLPIAMLLASMTAANAQVVSRGTIGEQTLETTLFKKSVTLNQVGNINNVKKTAPKKELAENQKYLYLTGADTPYTGVGLPQAAGKVKEVIQVIPANYSAVYPGAKVVGMRFLTNAGIEMTPSLYIAENQQLQKVAGAATIKTVASGQKADGTADLKWNEVKFDQSYEIPADGTELMVGFGYTQISGKSSEAMPFLVGQNVDPNANLLAYGNLGQGEGLYNLGTDFTMCLQLIIEKDGGFPDDFSMGSMITNQMVKATDKLPFQFIVQNLGSKEADGEFTVVIDDKEVVYLTAPNPIGATALQLGSELDLTPYNLADGPHTIGVKVKSVNGEAPSGNLKDDETYAQFRVYTTSTDRQFNLVEHFTSWTCGYCPFGYESLRKLQESRNDVAWVAIHCNMDPNKPDPYTLEDASVITNYSISGYPSFNLNRFNVGGSAIGTPMPSLDPEKNAEQFSKIFDIEDQLVPAQVKLGMKSNLELAAKPNMQPSKLTVTVSGKGVKNASKVLQNAVLGLYITEDGLTGKQYDGTTGNNISKYSHENTLIAIATENPWGDEIVWDGDNFEKTYEITIPKKTISYTAGKTLNAVAFVSLPYVIERDGQNYYNGDLENVWVNQCFFMDINKGETTGIKVINGTDSNATVVARFAADGTQISAPVKGVNILKMSDGTTRKVMVK